MKIHIPGFNTDSRGNQLLKWETRQLSGAHTRLHICAPSANIARQVEICLPETAQPGTERSGHQQDFGRTPGSSMATFLPPPPRLIDLLTEVLTLQHPPGMLSIALDFYKNPRGVRGWDDMA